MQELVSTTSPPELTTVAVPALIERTGPAGRFAWEEFFQAKVRNANTRRAYSRAVKKFLDWCEARQLEVHTVTPAQIAGYLDALDLSIPSKKLQLAAIRGLFDQLVLRHVCILNPAHSVKGERYSVLEGKTPEISRDQIRTLLNSINTDTLIGLRDKCILSTLLYTAARVGAVARLTRGDFVSHGGQYVFHFREKGGKQREIPVRHDLQQLILDYLVAARLHDAPRHHPLFPSAPGRSGVLSSTPLNAHAICRMLKRRLQQASLPTLFSPHSFRVYAAAAVMWRPGGRLRDLPDLPLVERHITGMATGC